MPNDRPPNHVEMAIRENMRLMGPQSDASGEPFWTPKQIEWMKKAYPPRCIRRNEMIEDHLRYAGMVEFVQDRAEHYEQQLKLGEEGPDFVEHV